MEKTISFISSVLFPLFLLAISGCAVHSSQDAGSMISPDAESYSSRQQAVTIRSEKGLYNVTLFSNSWPAPIGKIHDWTVQIEKADGTLFESGRITVNGGMPMHRHGFPTVPKVKKYLGGGNYRVEGIKFGMRGHWEIRFVIKEKNGHNRDRVVFDVNL